MREGRRPDRTDHARAARNRHRNAGRRRGPPRDAINDALDEIESHEIPGTPSPEAVKILQAAMSFPVSVGDRTVRKAKIQEGDPQHGAKRTDDHVSSYEVVFDRGCPECGGGRAKFEYHAHHHIAGGQLLACETCEHIFEEKDWG